MFVIPTLARLLVLETASPGFSSQGPSAVDAFSAHDSRLVHLERLKIVQDEESFG
eukprot:ANDGO_06843.mRNA.1 hypothetical protein